MLVPAKITESSQHTLRTSAILRNLFVTYSDLLRSGSFPLLHEFATEELLVSSS